MENKTKEIKKMETKVTKPEQKRVSISHDFMQELITILNDPKNWNVMTFAGIISTIQKDSKLIEDKE